MGKTIIETLRKQVEKQRGVEEGTILRFVRTIPHYQTRELTRYTYAAIFAGGRWFFTGRGQMGASAKTHAEMVEILADPTISDVEVATEFEAL